ncbi:MAG TPA: sialidase family protein [Candidatus Hydrogenedentes bacterium]|nr:sialidase family protein [Candidatus Hydrogenedentota bacterium]
MKTSRNFFRKMKFLIYFQLFFLSIQSSFGQVNLLPFDVKLETVASYDGGDWIWFHPRLAPAPTVRKDGKPAVVMTLQRHLDASDYYSGMYAMRTDDFGVTWTPPAEVPELEWRDGDDGETIAVCDATPGWHAKTGKIIVFGLQLRYSKDGAQLEEKPRSLQTAYSVHDPIANTWSTWRTFELKDNDTKFYISGPGCSQWLVQDDGNILLPIYYKSSETGVYSVTTLKCSFDGETVRPLEYGNDMHLNVERGLCEPSIALYNNTYYLTIRNDVKGYVTTSKDGLHYDPIKEWTFDDGGELGSYNTQQHWLTHSDGLFLIYTRRGANNDAVFRNRAPLFMAQVDPEKLVVMRATEKILMPNTGATFGNFGATAIDENESWVTDAEGIFGEALKPGVVARVLNARIVWSKPNRLMAPKQ